ncbi:MAG: sulfurtransferase [Acidobacteriia bacterium]|nr:sulfurtransferase [Terriglobia bacterium]
MALPELKQLVDEAKRNIKEIDVNELKRMQKSGDEFILIDVRDHPEVANGMIPGAKHLTRGMLEVNIDQITADKNKKIVLYCGGGTRSALSADNLKKMGFNNVISLAGGWKAWKESGA